MTCASTTGEIARLGVLSIPSSVAVHRNSALAKLLGSLFNSEELRWHLTNEPRGDALVDALPGFSVSHDGLTRSAVELLQRHGFIDREFFDRLAEVRPKRTAEIRNVRTQWLRGAELERGGLWGEDRYRLLELLGSGGFGQVWKALDNRTGRFVALKVLLEHHTDDRVVRRRFYRGASVLAELSHPAIVRMFSGVEQEGLRHFYAMEWIAGESLDALVHRRSFFELLDLVLQIGDGLSYIHAHGLLHRDVKPRNILVTPRGQAKLIDFDLVTGDTFDPMTTRAIGTLFFSPPEGFYAGPKTTAYDVYSLARTIEYLLRGGISTDSRPDALEGLDAPETVRTLLRAAVYPDPALRLQSVDTFCAALRAAYKRPTVVHHRTDAPTLEPLAEQQPRVSLAARAWRGVLAVFTLTVTLGFAWMISIMGTPVELEATSAALTVDTSITALEEQVAEAPYPCRCLIWSLLWSHPRLHRATTG